MGTKNHAEPQKAAASRPNRALTTAEAARYIGCSENYLRKARSYNNVPAPRYTRIGLKKIVYLIEHLDEWLDQQANLTGEREQEVQQRLNERASVLADPS